MNLRALRRKIARVALAYPSLYPIVLRKASLPEGEEAGDIQIIKERGEQKFLIRIADFSEWSRDDLEQALAEFVVEHEQSHAIQWRAEHQEKERLSDHDEEFGIALAKVTRINREKGS